MVGGESVKTLYFTPWERFSSLDKQSTPPDIPVFKATLFTGALRDFLLFMMFAMISRGVSLWGSVFSLILYSLFPYTVIHALYSLTHALPSLPSLTPIYLSHVPASQPTSLPFPFPPNVLHTPQWTGNMMLGKSDMQTDRTYTSYPQRLTRNYCKPLLDGYIDALAAWCCGFI